MPQSAKNSSQSWINDEQLHLDSYFKPGASKPKGGNGLKPQVGLKRKADNGGDSSSSKKPRQGKDDTKEKAKENPNSVTKSSKKKTSAVSSNKRKALGDITDTAITQVQSLGSSPHKESSSEAKFSFMYTSKETPQANAMAYSETAKNLEIIDISDDDDTVPDSENEWLDDTTIVSERTPTLFPRRTALFKRLGDLFLPTPPASISPLSRSKMQAPHNILVTPIPMITSSCGSRDGSETPILQGSYPTPMTGRPVTKTKVTPMVLAKLPSLESRNLSMSTSPRLPDTHASMRESSLSMPSDKQQEIFSSQTQYLIPFILSPKKESGSRTSSVPPSPSKNFQDMPDGPVSKIVIPSSQCDDSSILLCQATQGNKLMTRKIRSPIRSAPIYEIPDSPGSAVGDQLLTGPSNIGQLLPLPSATQLSTTQPESQEFTFGPLSSPTPILQNSQLSRKSDMVIDDSEDEDDITIRMPFKSKITDSLTQPDFDDVFQTLHNSRDTLISHSTDTWKQPITSTQQSTTQPDYDEDDLFNFEHSQKTGADNRIMPMIKAIDTQCSESTSITQDESQQSATFIPFRGERDIFSSTLLSLSPSVSRNDSQTEAIPTAVREFFEMIAGDDDFPESLLAIEREFAR